MTENILKITGTKTVSLVVAWTLIFVPTVSSAGVFSFVIALLQGKDNAISTVLVEEGNSQKLAILDAPLNHDPDAGKGGGDIATVGDSALLAQSGPSGTLADIKDIPKSDQISVYVVREGDTLSQISTMFGVSINTIKWANDISSSGTIGVGDTLVILPVSGVRHEVKSGETVRSITKKYGGHYEEVLAYNGLTLESVIKPGDIVIVPDGEVKASAPASTRARSVAQSSNNKVYEGYFMRPISGGTRTQGVHGYNGVDLASYVGAPIFAAADGVVIISKSGGWNGGYGNYVVIKHDNGTQTLYAHNSENIVYVGQSVVQGQVIGYVGSTGKSTGPHVHFEVRGAKNPF